MPKEKNDSKFEWKAVKTLTEGNATLKKKLII